MKKLNLFKIPVQIQVEQFFQRKELTINGASVNKDGLISVQLVITKDGTDYGDQNVSNLYEKFNIVITDSNEKDLSKYPLGKKVRLTKVDRATVYGDYQNNLSLTGSIAIINEQ